MIEDEPPPPPDIPCPDGCVYLLLGVLVVIPVIGMCFAFGVLKRLWFG